MGLTGASAEDSEAEYIKKICEVDIVTGKSTKAEYIKKICEVDIVTGKSPKH